jgi:hypothetical protein
MQLSFWYSGVSQLSVCLGSQRNLQTFEHFWNC